MTDTATQTAVNPAKLPRAVNVSTRNGDCLLCGEAFEPGTPAVEAVYPELAGEAAAFYLTGRRKGDGSADFRPEAQVEPRDAQVATRPQGCTCKGKRAHGKRCALYRSCSCPEATGRRGNRSYKYTKHRGGCRNKLAYADCFSTLPGYWDGFVHADCAALLGFAVPTQARRTWGRRTEGVFGGTAATGDATAALEAKRRESAERGRRELEAKLAAAEAERLAVAEREREALEEAQIARFRRLEEMEARVDREPAPEPEEEGPDPSAERFRRLILD